MRILLTLCLLTTAIFAYSQDTIPIQWDISGVNNCDEDGDITISENGSTIEVIGLEGLDCVACQSLSASGACTLPGNGSLCSNTVNLMTAFIDRSEFATVMLEMSIEPISSNLECTPCSTSDLAFIDVLTLEGEVLFSLNVCGSDAGDFGNLELPASCENFVVLVAGFKSNGGDEGFMFQINATGIGESDMNLVDLSGLFFNINQIGCPGDTSMIEATISDCSTCEISYRLEDGSINTNGMIPIPGDFSGEGQLIDVLITNQCGTTEVPSISIPVINNPELCDGVFNSNPTIFDQFPFLLDNYEDCTDIEFQIITSGIFTFIYVSDGQLFFQDGRLFCTEVGDRDCRALYDLHGMPTVIEGCNIVDEVDDLALSISESFRDEASNAICVDVTTNGIEDLLSFQFQIESEIEPVSFSSNIVDESTIVVTEEDSLFVIKSLWIAGDLIPIQLSDTDPIYTVCFDSDTPPGEYGFNLRDTDRLFSQFVVREPTGSFREIRDIGLTGNLVIEEDQGDGMDTDSMDMAMNSMDMAMDSMAMDSMDMAMDSMGMAMDSMDMEAETEEEDPVMIGSINEAIEIYPWLEDIDLCGRDVIAYSFGEFTFVSISTGSELELFFEDGSFYCSNSDTFDCLDFYGLNQVVGAWECPPEIGSIVSINDNFKSAASASDIVVFPNPFNNYIQLDSDEKIIEVRIFSSDGRQHPVIKSNETNKLNVASLESGAYFLQIKTAQKTVVKQIIKL